MLYATLQSVTACDFQIKFNFFFAGNHNFYEKVIRLLIKRWVSG